MTYIFEMASGTEYPGEELGCPSPEMTPGASHAACTDRQVELALRLVEAPTFATPGFPAGLDLDALIRKLED